jgi:Domain of unknown function (DUF5671)
MSEEDAVRLSEFVEASKAKGASDEFLAAFLTRRGWPVDDVYAALGRYWERATGLSVPERKGAGESSRDAYYYLLLFSTLATWATALGSMLFQFVDHWFQDAVSGTPFDLRQSVTWQMASIAVAFPIFLVVTRIIVREIREHPERLRSAVRKWLTYIALLGTAGTMIGDLIWFLDYFLMGEITARFVLKSLTVMVICGCIFFYYFGSLRTNTSKMRNRSFGIGASVVVVVAFCIGLGVVGTPSAQRHVRADVTRAIDIRRIAAALKSWRDRAVLANSTPVLPLDLSVIRAQGGLSEEEIADPETKEPYEYRLISGSRYELCANFAASERERGIGSPFWHHGRGRACFFLDAAQVVPW